MSIADSSQLYPSVPDPIPISIGLESVRYPPAHTRENGPSRPPGPQGPVNQFGFPIPGEQSPSSDDAMSKYYFANEAQWQQILSHGRFDDVVIGSGFCALAYIDKAFELDPYRRILVLERGGFWLPTHFQNLPLPFKLLVNSSSETYPWELSSRTFKDDLQFIHGLFPFFGGRSPFWSSWSPRPPLKLLRDFPESLKTTVKQEVFWKESTELLKIVKPEGLANKEYRVLQPYIEKQFKDAGVKTRDEFQRIEGGAVAEENRTDYGEATSLAVGKATGTSETVFEKFSTPGPLLKIYERQRELAKAGKGSPLTIVANTVVERFELDPHDKRVTVLHTSRGPLCFPGDTKDNFILATGAIPASTIVLNSVKEQRDRAGSRLTGHFLTQIVARFPLPTSLKESKEKYADALAKSRIYFLRELEGKDGCTKEEDESPEEKKLKDEIKRQEGDALRLAAYYLAGQSKSGLQYHADITVVHSPHPVKQQEDAMRLCPDFFAAPSAAQLENSEGHVIAVCVMLGEISEDTKGCHVEFIEKANSDLTTNIRAQVVMSDKEIELKRAMHSATKEAIKIMAGEENDENVQYWHDSGLGDWSGHWKDVPPSETEFQMGGLVHESSTLFMDDALPTNTRFEDTRRRSELQEEKEKLEDEKKKLEDETEPEDEDEIKKLRNKIAELKNKITELENKIAKLEGVIGKLREWEDVQKTRPAAAHASVDRNYRVYGTSNVYATGSAIFPTAGSWNPTRLMCGFVRDLARKLSRPDVFQQVFALSLASNFIRGLKREGKDPRGWLGDILPKVGADWEVTWKLAWGPVLSDVDGTAWYIAYHPSLEFWDGSVYPTYAVAVSGVLPSEETGRCLPTDFDAWLRGTSSVVPEGTPVDVAKKYIKISTADAAHRVLNDPSPNDNIVTFIRKHFSRSTRLVFAGHSAGGAVASTVALALVESAVASPHRILTYPTAAPKFGNKPFVDLFAERFKPHNPGGEGSYKGWNINIANTLDVIPQVRCALGVKSLERIYRDNPKFYGEPPSGGDAIFKSPPPAPSNVHYESLPSQYIAGPRPRVPLKSLADFIQIADNQHDKAYIKVIWDYPRSEKSQIPSLSTEITGEEAASKTEFDFPLSNSYPDRAGGGEAQN